MKLSTTFVRLASLSVSLAVLATVAVHAQSLTTTSLASPSTSTAPPTILKSVPPQALAAITKFHANIEIAEKGRDFASYKSAFADTTTKDFNFNSYQHASFSRDQYLKTKEQLMKEETASSTATWKVISTTPSTVDKSIDVTASRDLSDSITDTLGTYGTKGATHQVTTHAEYWEHWVPSGVGDSATWKIDDMDTNKLTTLVDGKEWKPAPTGLTALQLRAQQRLLQQELRQQQQQQRRSRYPVTFGGGNNTTF